MKIKILKQKTFKGFSLSEMLVAMAVFIIITTTTVSVFVSVANTWKKTRNIQANLSSSRTSNELISKTIRMSSLLKTANGELEDNQILMYNNSQNKCMSYRFQDNTLQLSEFVPGVDTECSDPNNYSDNWKTMAALASGIFKIKQTSLVQPYVIGEATVAMNIGGTQTQASISFRDYQGIIQAFDTSGNDEDTKLLIQSEADDNSTTFDDISKGGNHDITRHGDVKHKVGDARFGLSSIYFDGDNDYLSIDETNDLNVGSGDFTFDFLVKMADSGTRFFFSGDSAGDGKPAASYENGNIYFYIGTSNYVSWSKTLDLNTWYHLAFVRSEGDISLYVNGRIIGSAQSLSTSMPAANLKIGIAWSDLYDFRGYMEEFRYSSAARWTTDFVPNSGPYGDEIGICGDGDCNGSESCSSCPQECGVCSVCGDGQCNGMENCTYCAADCSCSGGLVCSAGSCVTP